LSIIWKSSITTDTISQRSSHTHSFELFTNINTTIAHDHNTSTHHDITN
jgi:hypothetical protein